MIGNLSKSKGFKGDKGEQGIQGIQGIQGEKGDVPAISFRYEQDTGNLYFSADGILADKDYVSTAKLVSKDELKVACDNLTKMLNELREVFGVRTVEISLPSSSWVSESDSKHYQVVSIAGVTEYSKIDLQPTVEQLAIFYEKDITFVTENDNGTVTVYCIGQKPTLDYTMQATITEVVL